MVWFKELQVDKIDLGIGKRSIVEQGVYNVKCQLTVPKELEKMNMEFRKQVKLLKEFLEQIRS